jgi:AcrR family transcriptional regulator
VTDRPDPRIERTRSDVLRSAIEVLVAEGWDAVTQPNVARHAGYSKATVYAHWPDRMDLLREAFDRYGEMPHHDGNGDVRADLVGELVNFRVAMVVHRLDRALAVLAERASALPEVADIRDRFVADGESPIRALLAASPAAAARHEAAVLMLSGLVTHAVLMHGEGPTDEVIAAAVDMVLDGLDRG